MNISILKPTKKFVLTVMEDKAEEVEAYIKEQKIKLKTPDSLIELFNFYNNL